MSSSNGQKPKLGRKPFRSFLISLNEDLLKIDSSVKANTETGRDLLVFESIVIALEDRRFFRHIGVDFWAFARNFWQLLTTWKCGGGSTIDMQFVRTATKRYERTFRRKVREIFLAVLIQRRYSKVTILRSYLAIAFFGSKMTGSDSAAQMCFKKPIHDLDMEESAFVAACLVYPRPLKPKPLWFERVERRAKYGKALYVSCPSKFE